MGKINTFIDQIKYYDQQIQSFESLKRHLDLNGYQDYGLIKAVISYYTYLEIGKENISVFFEMPTEFIDNCAFVDAYSMKGVKHLIVVNQKDDMSVEIASQVEHSNYVGEPILIYRYLSKDEVIVQEYYKEKNRIFGDPIHCYLLRLNKTKENFVEKIKLTKAEFYELYNKGYDSLEELNQGPKRNLTTEGE